MQVLVESQLAFNVFQICLSQLSRYDERILIFVLKKIKI
jgi:hypothetical protein